MTMEAEVLAVHFRRIPFRRNPLRLSKHDARPRTIRTAARAHRNIPAIQFAQTTHDGQAEARAAATGAFATYAALEQTLRVFRLDARAGVDHFDPVVAHFHAHRTFQCVLDGVADQVGQRDR